MNQDKLITDFKNGDIKAFTALHSMYNESILGVIFTIVGDQEVAQDICQDVFVKVWSKADQYDPSKGRFFTWVLNIARNKAIDYLRSRAFKEKKQNLSTSNFVDIMGGSKAFESKTDTIGLEAYVSRLKQRCIDLIDALYFKGFTQKETSESLEIPLGTVKTQIRNCINDLRDSLGIKL